jgi:hypothetical protein
MPWHIAFATCAYLQEPYGHPIVDAFDALTELVFAEAEKSPGFVARADYCDARAELSDFERDWGVWGKFAAPRFYSDGTAAGQYSAAQTLSVWDSVRSVRNFVYSGLHTQAVKNRHAWFRRVRVPTYVMWWLPPGQLPTWEEGARRIEWLADNGPTPAAFDLRVAFDHYGERLAKEGSH